ncbi:cation efflux system protein [Betaproteobacteria bacterium]|nr:cation efflux system protein [Betaproteobacteria bacterium]GHU02044.1 cation efflux system protein [Betaproteobacteria bacterium]GHU24640.1 cation efflux system protein [Betaproteobacteria bacterium]
MIARIIFASIRHRVLVLMAALALCAWGVWAVRAAPLDALPDLSDVQVIIRTPFPGQAPRIVEDQVTYPLTTTMLSVPGVKTVRGFSFFGDSFVYVLFDDQTDLYWARSRVLEYLNQAASQLPAGVQPSLGPDASGVGWIYEYALVDRSGRHSLADLRALQDWFLKFELKTITNVAEVATIGGMVKQYQIVPDPTKLAAFGLTHNDIAMAVEQGNQESGGAALELAETEYMVRVNGYLRGVEDFRAIALKTDRAGTVVRLADVARVQLGPEMRRGIAELDGEGEVAGAVVILRSGKNAYATINEVRARLAILQKSLPAGVEIVPVYDRGQLIEAVVDNLGNKLLEEFLVVTVVCALFLWHLRSALVAIVALPLGVLAAFIVMRYQGADGVSANMMSLGGIAIAIGAMVDAAIVMIENAHKKLEAWQAAHPGAALGGEERWQVIGDAAAAVGPALFFSLLIITLSFIPVFALEAQEGRMFAPLAYTKSFAMAAAAGVSVTLIPVLMGYWIRGRIPHEEKNPLSRVLIHLYAGWLNRALAWPKTTLMLALLAFVSGIWPAMRLGGEFLPAIDEGDLLYMPTALPGLSVGKAGELLQQTDRLIKRVPEVASVFGKAGRAETATDPAPLEMFETVIRFKPRAEWRPGMTPEKLVQVLDAAVQIPGLANLWIPPIRNRIDMLATGIKSPIGIKLAGTDLHHIEQTAVAIEEAIREVPGVSSALAERLTGGRYLDIDIKREVAGRFGMNIADVQSAVALLVGGQNIGETIEGTARYPINLRYPREWRDSLAALRELPLVTPRGELVTLETLATVSIVDGPPMLKSENGRLSSWIYVDVRGRDLAAVVHDIQTRVNEKIALPPGVSISYSGQFEYLERANARLKQVVPITLAIILLLLYFTFSRADEALLIMVSLPFALVGGIWFLYLMDYHFSIAAGVGFIALAGVAAEFGVVMLIYLKEALLKTPDWHLHPERDAILLAAIREGAVQRVRPKAMTVAVIVAGLLPIFLGKGAGSEVMSRIAAPMVGGMISAPLLSLFVIPVLYLLLRRRFV